MNRALLALSLLLIVVAAANFIPGRAQVQDPKGSRAATQAAPATINPLKVALLKWFSSLSKHQLQCR